MKNPAGLTPREWERRLEAVVDSPVELKHVLSLLQEEIRRERTWLHEHPSPSGLLRPILTFFGRPEDDDVAALAEQIKEELRRERRLRKRYRSWNPGETWSDRLAPYLSGFAAEVAATDYGLQFPGYSKYAGLGDDAMAVFYLNHTFPGRDPANFMIRRKGADLVLERIYRMELPRIDGASSVARTVLAEMIVTLVPDLAEVERLVIDNAANLETRKALLRSRTVDGEAIFEPAADAEPSQTILGHLMLKLAVELGLQAGDLSFTLLPFGMLRLDLPVEAARG